MTGIDPANPVATLTDYELHHVGEHLEAAGDTEGLERVLALEWGVEVPSAPDRTDHQSTRWWSRWRSRRASDAQSTIVRHHNAWYEAKNATGDATGYRNDVDRTWRLISRVCAEAARTPARVPIERELRCALLAASISSVGYQLPGPLLRALVQRGVWDESNALAYAARDKNKILALLPVLATDTREEVLRGILASAISSHDSVAIFEIAAFLSEPQVLSALQDGPDHPDYPVKSGMFAQLASRLIDLGRVELALKVVQDHVTDRLDAVRVLAELAPHLDEAHAREALEMTRGWDSDDRHRAFAAVYPRLASLGHVSEALDVTAEINSPFSRAEMLSRLAPALDLEGCRQALALVPRPEHDEPYGRATTLLALGASAAHLGDKEWGATIIDDAVTTIAGADIYDFKRIVAALAHERPEAAFQIAVGFEDRQQRMVALAAAAPHLPPHLKDLARQAAMQDATGWTLSDEPELSHEPVGLVALSAFDPDRVVDIVRAQWKGAGGDHAAAAELAPGLPAQALTQLLDITAQVLDDRPRAQARVALDAELAALGDRLALERLAAAEPADVRSAELAAIAPRLPKDMLTRAIEILAKLPDAYQEAPAHTLAARMTDDQMRTLLDDAARRASDRSFAVLVSAFSEHLSVPMVEHALKLTLSRQDKRSRETAAVALAPRLDVHQLARLRSYVPRGRRFFMFQDLACAVAIRLAQLGHTAEALKVATEIEDAASLVEAIRGIAPHLSGADELRHLEQLAQAVREPGMRAQALGALSTCAMEPDQSRLRGLAIADAEKAAEPVTWGHSWMPRQPNPSAMARLARELGGDVYERALALAKSARDEDRISAITQLGPLEGAALEGALCLARRMEEPYRRDQALGIVLKATQCPSAELVAETLRACTAEGTHIHNDQHKRLRLVAAQLQRLGPEIAHEQMSKTLLLLVGRRRDELARFIGAMAPLIGWLGGMDAIRRTEGAMDDVARWWP